MKYENPNPSAFFFDDGDFLNLEHVVYVQFSKDGIDATNEDGELISVTEEPTLEIYFAGGDVPQRRLNPADADRQRLTDALRVYHSKL